MGLTRDRLASVRSVLVFNKAKAVHELDIHDLTLAMLGKVVMHVLLRS